MILTLSVENWMSFKDKATLSMVGGRERQHGERVPKVRNGKTKVLPAAAIFGGNASGKSNFVAALGFAKKLVVGGTSPKRAIPVDTFLLDAESEERPSSFFFELAIGEGIFEYSFKVTRRSVLEERLVKIGGTSERELFSRRGGEFVLPSKDERLHFVSKGTRDNQLFLANSVSQKIDTFKPVYDWFDDSLTIVSPTSYFAGLEQFMDEGWTRNALFNQALSAMDTGIDHLSGEEFSLENWPSEIKESLMTDLEEGESSRLWAPDGGWAVVTRKGGKLQAKKMVAYHAKADGSKARLEMRQESDGTRRAIDLLPAFLWMVSAGSAKVIVIDELDRSLHTALTRSLLRYFFSACSKDTRAQILFTTHDVMLMDQQLLRRDEMWVTERGAGGASTLTSLWEYGDIRSDMDIRKLYLRGRLGGVPRLMLDSVFAGPFTKGGGGAWRPCEPSADRKASGGSGQSS